MKKENKYYLISDIVVFILMIVAALIFNNFFNLTSIGISFISLLSVIISEIILKKYFKRFSPPTKQESKTEQVIECIVILLLGQILIIFNTGIWVDLMSFYLAYFILSRLFRNKNFENWIFKLRSR